MTTPPVPPEAVTTAHEDLTAWMLQWEWMSPLSSAQVRDVCRAVVDRVLEVAVPVLRDHWLSGGALHELVFTDREARPAKWQTRCGREDVPLERTTSPDPAGYYQVDCPACLRVAELEALADEILAAFRPRRDRAGHRASTRRDVVDRWRVTLAGEK